MKVQIVADALSRDILCISMGKGSQHDFKMLQESKVCFSPQIQVIADKGYQGIKKLGASLFCVGKDEFGIVRSGIVVTL